MGNKLISFGLMGMLLLCLLTGCGGSAGNGTEVAANSGTGEGIYHAEDDEQEEETEDDTEVEYTPSPVRSMEEQRLDPDDPSGAALDDAEALDFYQSYAASNGNGYFFGKNDYLYFYDLSTRTTVPVCSQANCTHSDYDCNAYVGDYDYERIGYWDGYLYMVYVGKNTVYLARVSADGSTREDEYMALSTFALEEDEGGGISSHTEIPEFCVCQGYVYYTFKSESVTKVRRMELGSSEAEVVYTSEGVRPVLWNLYYNGDYVFFKAGNFTDESCENIERALVAYNVKSGECRLVSLDAQEGSCVRDGTLYYNIGSEIYSVPIFGDGVPSLITDNGSSQFCVRGKVLYIWSNDVLTAYDLDGNELAQVDSTGYEFEKWCYGDTDNMLACCQDGTEGWYILGLSDFLAGSGEWVKI